MPPGAAGAVKEVIRDDKVVVNFRHTPGVPMLQQSKFKFPASSKISTVASKLRLQLGITTETSLMLFCNSSFAPPPDALLGDVARCFHVDGVLELNYCSTPAWG
jgi:ubiquitin-like protein ATG12|mmetsp:Transcript_52331/g.117553  ORF Transcript_52331/g.117553 Transcript_52331/m.117553 type:complete len:104 (-) Transcript_52331:451-762(-)